MDRTIANAAVLLVLYHLLAVAAGDITHAHVLGQDLCLDHLITRTGIAASVIGLGLDQCLDLDQGLDLDPGAGINIAEIIEGDPSRDQDPEVILREDIEGGADMGVEAGAQTKISAIVAPGAETGIRQEGVEVPGIDLLIVVAVAASVGTGVEALVDIISDINRLVWDQQMMITTEEDHL